MVLVWQAFALPLAGVANDDRELLDFEHTEWKARHGLPGQVSELAQTTDGYLWLATGQTLYRFDGLTFERIRTTEGESFPRVMALAAHPDGSLWVGLVRGGLVRLSNGETTSFGVAQGVPQGVTYDLAIGDDGIVVAAIADQLLIGGKHGWMVQTLAGAAGNPAIRRVLVDRDGGAWAGGARLWYRAPGAADFLPSAVAVHGVAALAQAPDGGVWAAESASATVFPVTSTAAGSALARRHPYLPSAMVFDLDGGLWMGTTGDGIRYIPSPGSDRDVHTTGFTGAEGLSGEVVGAALRDREGNLWFGTNAGLDRFRQPDLVKAGFPGSAYNFALAVDAEGALWAGSMNRNAMRLANRDLATSPVVPPITVAHRNLDGGVWLAGPNGFWKSRGAEIERLMDLPPGVDAPAVVRAVVDDGKGRLWASIHEHGLYRWQAGAWSQEPVRGPLPSQRMPVRAVLDRAGHPWFGYRDNLLVSLQDGQVLRWGPEDGLGVGHVTALLVTESRFWVGGTEGLSLFDGTAFIPMRFAEGFRISGLHGLVKTVTGELWLHGNDGLFRIESDQIARFIEDPSSPVSPKRLGPIEPLADDVWQVRPLPTAQSGTDGTIWIATSVGVRRADPRRVAAGAAPPPAHVVSLRADDGPIRTEPRVVLPALARQVAIAYTAPGLRAPETLRFRYRLRGYDDAWHHPGSAREATFIGLPPGRYDFELSAAYGDGPWSTPDSIQFEIPPAVHQTWQFMALCTAAAVLLLWLAYRARVRHIAAGMRSHLEVQHRERDRIARELHDTLLQGVQGLMLRLQAAVNSLPANEPARKAIELALDQADQVIDLRVPRLRPGGLLDALTALGGELSAVHGVRFQAIGQGTFASLPPMVEEELFRIAQEALVNAFRHADARGIELELTSDREGMRLRIRDDGAGMAPGVVRESGRAGHWGVIGMRERAGKIGARLQIWSREGSGMEVDVCLPWTRLPGHVRSNRDWFRWLKRPR
jgi:signal transduction histidine kinase/ligand-binding sensor domain-containing protein